MAIEVELKEIGEWKWDAHGRTSGPGRHIVFSASHVEHKSPYRFFTPLNFEETKKVAKMVQELEEFRKRFG